MPSRLGIRGSPERLRSRGSPSRGPSHQAAGASTSLDDPEDLYHKRTLRFQKSKKSTLAVLLKVSVTTLTPSSRFVLQRLLSLGMQSALFYKRHFFNL